MNVKGEFLVKDGGEKKFSIREVYQVVMSEEKPQKEMKTIQKGKRQYKITMLMNGNKPATTFMVSRDVADRMQAEIVAVMKSIH